MQLLKQSTAATLKIGPFVDTDGAATTGLTISQADVRLSKNGGNMAQKNEATSATHDELGMYDVPVDATDTNTLGRLDVVVAEAGALIVKQSFMVVPANVYDSLVGGSDTLDVQVTGMGAGVVTAAAIATDAIDADAMADGAITAGTFAADAITAAKLAADVTTELQNGLATAAALASVASDVDAIGTIAAGIDADTSAIVVTTDKLDDTLEDDGGTFRFTANALEESPVAATSTIITSGTAQAGAASAITLAAGASSGNDAYRLATVAIMSGTGAGQSRVITAYDGTTKVATVISPWDITPDNTSVYILTPFGVDSATVTAIAEAVWAALRAENQVAGSFGEYVLADITRISGDAAAADNLEAMVDGTGLTLTNVSIPGIESDLTAVKAKTDSLTFSVAGQVDAHVKRVRDDPVTGAPGTAWGRT